MAKKLAMFKPCVEGPDWCGLSVGPRIAGDRVKRAVAQLINMKIEHSQKTESCDRSA